jgi:signal peptidase II
MSDTTPNMPEARAGAATPSNGLRPVTFCICVLLVFAGDQFSKHWIVSNMFLGQVRPIFGNAFRLMLTHNTGGAWSLLPHGNTLFALFAGVASIGLLIAYFRVGRAELQVGSAFALALGGALGNLIDRVRLGYVVDFFDLRIINWPIFNVADSAITTSILLLLIYFLRTPAPHPVAPGAEAPGQEPAKQEEKPA